VEANSTGGQGSRRAVAPSDDDTCHVTSNNIVVVNYEMGCGY
jgi:hypothetical protein